MSWCPHLCLQKQPLPQAQQASSLNLPDNEICHVFRHRSRTWRSLHHRQGNGPPPSSPHQNGLAATMHTHPNRQLHCCWCHQPHHCPAKNKSMDLCLWWLHCQESQQQFRYYWDKGSHIWADYLIKHHPPIYHEANRPIHASAAAQLP